MGCKYACSCAGFCGNCGSYEPEQYLGHAEDIMAQGLGYADAYDYEQQAEEDIRAYEDYCAQQYEDYCEEQYKLYLEDQRELWIEMIKSGNPEYY